jgi:hypothetical protein
MFRRVPIRFDEAALEQARGEFCGAASGSALGQGRWIGKTQQQRRNLRERQFAALQRACDAGKSRAFGCRVDRKSVSGAEIAIEFGGGTDRPTAAARRRTDQHRRAADKQAILVAAHAFVVQTEPTVGGKRTHESRLRTNLNTLPQHSPAR